MRTLRYAIATFFLCLASPAFAVNCAVTNGACFWIGGTGTMDFATDSAHWSNSSGGASCTCEPISTNSLTFDGSSGGGTVTVNATVNATSLTFGAFTGTLDFSVNNNNVNIVNAGGTALLSGTHSGSGTPTLNMGTGTWTIGSSANAANASINFLNTTGLTITPQPSLAPIVILSGGIATTTLFFGGKSWGPLTVTGSAANPSTFIQFENGNTVSDTFASLTINAPAYLTFRSQSTTTITGALTVSGSSWNAPVYIASDGASAGSNQATLGVGSASSIAYSVLRNITGATSTITCNPCVNLGNASGTISLTNPGTGGGGGFIIGGG